MTSGREIELFSFLFNLQPSHWRCSIWSTARSKCAADFAAPGRRLRAVSARHAAKRQRTHHPCERLSRRSDIATPAWWWSLRNMPSAMPATLIQSWLRTCVAMRSRYAYELSEQYF